MSHLWNKNGWKKYYLNVPVRKGLRIRYSADIDNEVKESIKRFVSWLRQEYYFPFRVVVYVKSAKSIIAKDGEAVSGTFFSPFDRYAEPYARVATGDYLQDKLERGRDTALAIILRTIAHELTHYFQWINDVNLTDRGTEYQAYYYSEKIVDEYAEYTDHP